MPDMQEDDFRTYWYAMRQLPQQPLLIERLKSKDSAEKASKELGISDKVRLEIISRLNDFEVLFHPNSSPDDAEKPQPPGTSNDTEQEQEIKSARDFFNEAFSQLRRAYDTSRMMSVTMFVIGVIFLGIAAAGAILRPENVAMVAVIGGVGIVQIVALFYRNPLTDIARVVSNAQQAKIVITSYVIGISLIHDSIGIGVPNEEHLKNLLLLTDKALRQLQKYTEEPASASDSSPTSD